MTEWAIEIYSKVAEVAFPVAVVFELGNLIVGTVLRVAFGGKFWFGK